MHSTILDTVGVLITAPPQVGKAVVRNMVTAERLLKAMPFLKIDDFDQKISMKKKTI